MVLSLIVIFRYEKRQPKWLPSYACRGRTLDTLIKSQVLYQLSYKRIFVGAMGMLPELRVQRYCLFLKPPNIY